MSGLGKRVADNPMTTGSRRLARALVLVIAAATVACWGHLALVAVRRHALGVFSWKWWLRDQVLLSALGYLMVFALLSIVPVVVHLVRPRWVTLARLAAFEAILATFAVLLVLERVAPWALFIVALAAGVEAARRLEGRDEIVRGWSLRIAGAGLLATVLVAGLTAASRDMREWRATAALSPAPTGAPNVLLLILDTVRASSLGLYGGPVNNTPNLARRASAGIVFEQAYSTASWTLPSHSSIFTGQYASHTGADWKEPLDTRYPTLAEELQQRGWATGGFVANTVAAWYRTGLARGFLHYADIRYSVYEAFLSTTFTQSKSFVASVIDWQRSGWLRGAVQKQFPFTMRPHGNYLWHDAISAEHVADAFLAWQAVVGEERPFFAFLNMFDAHAPYLPPAPYRSMFGTAGTDRERYLGAIAYQDATIEMLFRELERRGVLDNTIVVITSDHGELFGEHNLGGHGNALYRDQLRVPLIVLNAPGMPSPSRITEPVSLRDLGATILALTGAGRTHRLGGNPLLPHPVTSTNPCASASPVIAEVSRGINVDARSFAGRADQKTVVNDTVQVMASTEQTLNVYDLRRDSLQLRDLAQGEAGRKMRDAGRTLLERTLRERGIAWDLTGRPLPCPPPGPN